MKILRIILSLALVLLMFSCKKHTTELLTIPDPTLTPTGGEWHPGQIVRVECSEIGADVHYTLDGSDPTEQDSLLFTVVQGDNNFDLTIPDFFPAGTTSATLKVKAFKEGMHPSGVVSGTYSVTYYQTVTTPIFVPPSGNITTATQITIVDNPSTADTYYTLDGTDPTQNSILYEEPFSLTQTGQVTIKAKSYKALWNPSEIATATYNVSTK